MSLLSRVSGRPLNFLHQFSRQGNKCYRSLFISGLFRGRITSSSPYSTIKSESKRNLSTNNELEKLEDVLNKRVVGQSHVVEQVVDALQLAEADIGSKKRPIANFLFLGPTGVGKTEMAKALAEEYYGSKDSLVRFDMSKFTDSHTASGLVGSTAGFVGYDEGGLLTNPIIENPNRVLLFDEFEKAHRAVQQVLLSVMGSGEIRDSKGRLAMFDHSVIILTSNLCSQEIQRYCESQLDPVQIEKSLRYRLMEGFSPELYGRVTPLIFKAADQKMLKAVVTKMVNGVREMIEKRKKISLHISPKVVDYIGKNGFSFELGFRPTEQFIMKKLTLPIAKLINEGKVQPGQSIKIGYDPESDQIDFLVLSDIKQTGQSKILVSQIKRLLAEEKFEEALGHYRELFEVALHHYQILIGRLDSALMSKQDRFEQILSDRDFRKGFEDFQLDLSEFFKLSDQIADICLNGKIENQNFEMAYNIYSLLSLLGQKEGDAQLGYMYLYGIGVEQDFVKARSFLENAASYGNPNAFFYLAKIYANGLGLFTPDKLKAEEYFIKAGLYGPADLIDRVGVIFDEGKEVPRSLRRAVDCFKRAAADKSPYGNYHLAWKYIKGEGVKENLEKGIDYLLQAGRLGVNDAYSDLATIYSKGPKGDCGMSRYYSGMKKRQEKSEKSSPFWNDLRTPERKPFFSRLFYGP